jgi:hypothetical protein
MSSDNQMGKAARGLGAALLNATLLLTALVLVLAVTLVVQMRGLAHDGRDALRAEVVELRQQLAETRAAASQALVTLETRPATEAGDLAPVRDALAGLLDGLESRAIESPDPEMQRLVFQVFRAIADRMFAP